MSILEEKIKKNKDLFDKAEPSDGHFDKFAARLKEFHGEEEAPRAIHRSRLWKVAAVIAVLMGISAVLIFTAPERSMNSVAASELPLEIREAKLYYEEQANKKLEQINQCASTSQEAAAIRDMAIEEMKALEENSTALESELQVNTESERVKNALIVNYQTKSKILDNILYRLCNI